MPTTSRPQRRSRSKLGLKGNPLKCISFTLTLAGDPDEDLGRLAAEKGLAVERRGGVLSLSFKAATADEANERIGLLSALLSSRA